MNFDGVHRNCGCPGVELILHDHVNSRLAFEQKRIFKKECGSTVRGERCAQNPQTKQKGET